MEERAALKFISGECPSIMVFRLNIEWTKIVFQLCEHYLKHLTRVLEPYYHIFLKKILSRLIR